MNSFLNESTSQEHGPYASMYPIPAGALPLGQPYEAITSQGGPWAFPMASMASSQGSLPTAGGLMAMPPNFAPGFPAPGSSVPTSHATADAQNVSPNAQTPTRAPAPSAEATSTPSTAPQPQENEATRTNARRRAPAKGEKDSRTGRRKIKIEYIDDDSRRHITFSKRKAGIMKKAYELATLTGTQVLLLVVSQTGLVYTFTTPKLEAVVKEPEGRNLIQECLNAPDASDMSLQAGPSSAPLLREEADEGEEGEEDEDEEDEGLDMGRADAGLSSHAMGGVPAPPFAPAMDTPLFHPGWAPVAKGKRADDGPDSPAPLPHAALKRRRTQPNLSMRASAPDVTQGLYHPNMVPVPHLDRSALPMFFGSPHTPHAQPPEKRGASPSNGADASFRPKQEAPRSS